MSHHASPCVTGGVIVAVSGRIVFGTDSVAEPGHWGGGITSGRAWSGCVGSGWVRSGRAGSGWLGSGFVRSGTVRLGTVGYGSVGFPIGSAETEKNRRGPTRTSWRTTTAPSSRRRPDVSAHALHTGLVRPWVFSRVRVGLGRALPGQVRFGWVRLGPVQLGPRSGRPKQRNTAEVLRGLRGGRRRRAALAPTVIIYIL